MDAVKIGQLIRNLRNEQHMTQRQLADRLHVSDKAVSKWERGQGLPDVTLLQSLSELLGVDVQVLLSGELETNESLEILMDKMRFYYCPTCGNSVLSLAEASISCCGKRIRAEVGRKAVGGERLRVERSNGELFIDLEHRSVGWPPIAYMAVTTCRSIDFRYIGPHWQGPVRFPGVRSGYLSWFSPGQGVTFQRILPPADAEEERGGGNGCCQ